MSEAQWTGPSAWCPAPGYWHADDGQATEREVTELVAAFVRALQPEVVTETGTWRAQTTEAIGLALRRNGHGHLYAVEIDPDLARLARQGCTGLPVTVVTGDSLQWEPPTGIGFAWVDGSERRDLEIEHLLPCLLPGAIVGIHDTAPHQPDRGKLRLLEERGALRVITLRTPRGVSFVEVP